MTNNQVVQELAGALVEALENQQGGQAILLKPALNIVKMKMANMTEAESADILDKVHFLSARIEKLTGQLSPYHLDTVDAVTEPETALVKS